jgi:hypothetical protein
MTYALKLHGILLGRSELEDRDPSTRLVGGVFHPGTGYALVEPVFTLRVTNPERYVKARDTLAFELADDGGAPLPASDVEIAADGDALSLRARVEDAAFWSRQ